MTESVLVNSTPYDTYATVSQADDYLQAVFGNDTWVALTDDHKGQALVSATRLLDRQCWLGSRSSDSQPLEWPRKDTGTEGVDEAIVPADIISGSIELAFAIGSGSEVVTNATPGAQSLQSIKAGSVSLSYFRGAEGVAAINRFPCQRRST